VYYLDLEIDAKIFTYHTVMGIFSWDLIVKNVEMEAFCSDRK
jgi:hypothetical protein